MTVPSEQSRITYDTDGTSVSFPVPFRFLQNRDLRVTLIAADESSTTLVLDVDYSVTGAGQQSGGTLSTVDILAAGATLLIERIVAITQETEYQRNDPFPERAHERALDKLTMICQQLAAAFGLSSLDQRRVLSVRDTESQGIGFLPLKSERASMILGFDANGDPIAVPSDLPAIEGALQRAEQAATTATEEAADAADSASAAHSAAIQAALSESNAGTSAEIAAAAGKIYPDAASGVANVAAGQYFWVVSLNDSDVLELWRNNAGSPLDTGKRTTTFPGVLRLNAPGVLPGWVDPFFRHIEIGDTFAGRERWWKPGDPTTLTLVQNPIYGGRALRKTVPASAQFVGPRVYLDEMGAGPGDTITLHVEVIGTGEQARLIGNVLDENGITIGAALTSSPNFVVASSAPQMMTIEAVMPVDAHSVYIRPTTTIPGDVFDIVSFWAHKGPAFAGPSRPTFKDDVYASMLAAVTAAHADALQIKVDEQGGILANTLDPIATAVDPLIVPEFEQFALTLTNAYLRWDTGVATETGGASYRTSQQIACLPADEIYATVWSQSALMAGICYYDEDAAFISSELRGTGTGTPHADYRLTIPENARFFAICGYNTYLPSARKVVARNLNVFDKQQSDARYARADQAGAPRYGIRWSLNSSASTCERTEAAIGMMAQTVIGTGSPGGTNNFDSIYPWSAMRRCAIRVLASGAVRLLYEGDAGYVEDGSAGDIFIEIPRFGYERRIESGYEYRTITREGLPAHPAFVEPGRVLDHIYVAAYNAAEADGKLQSLPGTLPTMNQVAQAFLDKATAKGRGFTLLDMRTVDALQNLLWIEHATRNSTTVIGHGWAELKQAQVATWKFVAAEPAANRWIMEQPITANNKEQLFVGQDIVICDTAQTNIIARRKIASVEYDSPASGQTAVYFDGAPIDTTAAMFAGSCPQQSGQADAMSYHTGRLDRPKTDPSSTIPRDELNPNRYREMENLVGDVWRLLPDVTFVDGVMYVCDDMTQYEFHASTGAYRPVAIEPPPQTNNDDGHWVHALALDRLNPRIAVAQAEGAGDHMSRFGAFWYLNPGPVVIAQGGGFDHKKRCNLLTYRAWIEPTRQWYLYGARLQFKAI